jgi:capsid portal protein
MTANLSDHIISEMQTLRFDIQDALLKVKNNDLIDLSGIDERVGKVCSEIKSHPQATRDQAEPIMRDIITALEELAERLQDAIGDDDDDDDDHE